MKKVGKALLSWLLTICLLITPFSGVFVFAAEADPGPGPSIEINIGSYEYVTADTVITVTYAANGDTTVASCDTRLENVSLGTGETVSFTPAEKDLKNGSYTLVAKAVGSNGVTSYDTVTFIVCDETDISFTYAEDESIVPSDPNATATTYEVEPLDYTMGYGATADGQVALDNIMDYDASTAYGVQYMNESIALNSMTGIPYQTFDVALNGKTEGSVIVRYTGATKVGERIAVKVYNPSATTWDTIGTITSSGSVSEAVDVATYADNGEIHVMAVLDYVTNGSNTMIWSTDPQHYTKFEDLNAFYYEVYQYAADEYVAGNVGYIMTTGDLVDDTPATTAAIKQWEVADNAMQIIEAVDMPNGLVSGNHDVNTVKNPDYSAGVGNVDYSKYTQHFGADRYNDKPWYGGSLNNNISHYDLVTIGNTDFVILFLGYGVEATDETIVWANEVLQTYSHRTAIVATHQYLEASTADRAPESRAQLIFDTIVDPNPNVKMVICGHDDGSIVNEVTASDGRIVYELLADYQFVEAEDDAFYEEYYKAIDPDGTYNGHYIGSVSECCGDGYIRLLTVEGSTLSSITYSPVTGRYNPFGDRENIKIDLGTDAPDREITTVAFSAYVLGEESTEDIPSVPTAIVITKTTEGEGDVVVDALQPAIPEAPYTNYAVVDAPNVEYKTDVLNAAGLSDGVVNTAWAAYANLGLTVDLTKTPYLYYSITVPEGANFTFALVNNTNYAPWLVFRDATGEGAYLNNGANNWDAYTNREQYITASETGCVDMRTISTDPAKATWIANQLTFYNANAVGVTVNYMFFGSEPIAEETVVNSSTITYHHTAYTTFPEAPEAGTNTPVDLAALNTLIAQAEEMDLTPFTDKSINNFQIVLDEAKSIDTTNDNDVSLAYYFLTRIIAALEEPVETIDPSTLQSIHDIPLSVTAWTASGVQMVPHTNDDGTPAIQVKRTATVGWASMYRNFTYQIKSNNGKIYLNLDVEADAAWCVYVVAEQAGTSGNLRMNFAIDNAFNATDCDSFNGIYKGVYDVTEAFVAAGMDPSATITITSTYLWVVPGENAPTYATVEEDLDTVTYRHVEFMTDTATTDVVDTTALTDLIVFAEELDESLYTTGTWSKLEAAIVEANTSLENTEAAQADINLAVVKLQKAIDKLKLLTDIVEEPEGSLLPADESKWIPNIDAMNIYRDENNITVLENTNNAWPYADYTLETPIVTTVADHQLSVDITVASETNMYLYIEEVGNWVPLPKYISAAKTNSANNLSAGTYDVDIPFSSITEITKTASESITISKVRVYSVGNAGASSAVTIRQMQITDYVAPPPVEDELLDLMPTTEEEYTIVAGDGTVTIENGVLTAVNNGDGDLRITIDKFDYFDLSVLNALHLQFTSEMPFKMAYYLVGNNTGGGAQWLNTSGNYANIFEVDSSIDRAAAGEYDVNLEMRDLAGGIADKSSVSYSQFIILLTGQGTFTLNVAEMIEYDGFVWDENMTTYGEAATPDNPFYAHAAQTAPTVEKKVDLLKTLGLSKHPTVTAWTQYGNYANNSLGIEVDLNETPYLYYSFAMAEGANFTFAFYGDQTNSPWLSFLDSHATDEHPIPWINQTADQWNSYANREQYATTSQTGCIDMREYAKSSALLWAIKQINFYNSTGNDVIISYFFFGSEPITEAPAYSLGDVDQNGTVTITDAVTAFQYVNGTVAFNDEQFALADIDNSGDVTISDAVAIFQYINGTFDLPE